MVRALRHSSRPARRSAAADAPTKFGIRPRAPGNAATRRSSRSDQMRSRMACLRSSKGPLPPASNREHPRLEEMEGIARAEPHVQPQDEADGEDEQLHLHQLFGDRDPEQIPDDVSPWPREMPARLH